MRTVEQEFDAKAGEYETNRLSGWYMAQGQLVMEMLLPRLPDEPPCTVLDIGCGTGWFLRRLTQAAPHVRAFGIDLSARMVALARARAAEEGAGNLTFMQGDWEDARVLRDLVQRAGSQQIDVVTCISTFHYLRRPAAALRRMARVLSPGGDLVVLERGSRGSALTRAWDRVHRHVLRDGVRFHDESDVVGWLREAGLEDARVAARIRKLLWQGKLYTSLAVIRARKASTPTTTDMQRGSPCKTPKQAPGNAIGRRS